MAYDPDDKYTVEFDKRTKTGLVYEGNHCIWEGPLDQAKKYAESLNQAAWYRQKARERAVG